MVRGDGYQYFYTDNCYSLVLNMFTKNSLQNQKK